MKEHLSAREAETAHDLGKHAADTALEAIMRVCGTGGDGKVNIAATVAAFAYMQMRIKVTSKAMDLIMPNFSESVSGAAELLEEEQSDEFMEFAEAAAKRHGL